MFFFVGVGIKVVHLDVAVSVDDIVREGASVHAVDEVPLPRNPFRAGHHRHLVRKRFDIKILLHCQIVTII